jgi:hypothetical protein
MKNSIAFITLLLTIAGCANIPVTVETAKPIKDHKQIKFKKKSRTRNALLSFVRDNGIVGSTCDSRITVNGEEIGDVGTGKIINIYLKPGKHKVKIAPHNATVCGNDKMESTITLRRNSEKHFRIALMQKLKMTSIKRAPVEL